MNAQTTALTLQAGNSARFPVLAAGDWFYVTVSDDTNMEIMKVTATASDQFTVVRGVDNTTARQWAAGVRVQLNICAAAWSDLSTDLAALPPLARTFAAAVTLSGAPTANLHAATRKYVTDNKMPKTTALQAPIGFTPLRQLSNKVYLGWLSGDFSAQIDSTYMGRVWRDATFNPATKANAGSQLQWNTSIYQAGAIDFFVGGTFDLGSPWVMEGYTAQLPGGNSQYVYPRLIWYRNQ